MDQQSVMVRLDNGCHFEREPLFHRCSLKWCPPPSHPVERWDFLRLWMSCDVAASYWGAACCWWLFASYKTRRRHQRRAKLAGWIIHPFLLHTSDGATVTCVSSNPSHNAVCTPQAATQGCMLLKSALSVWKAICLVLLLCPLQQVLDTEPPRLHPSVFFFFRSTGPACCRAWCSEAKSLNAVGALRQKVDEQTLIYTKPVLQRFIHRQNPYFIYSETVSLSNV